jgi:hypothetical protein
VKAWKDPRQQRYYLRNRERILEKRRAIPQEVVYVVPENKGEMGVGQKFQLMSALGVPWGKLPGLVARDYVRIYDAESVAAEAMVVAVRGMAKPQDYTRYQLVAFLRQKMKWALGMELRRLARQIDTVEMNEEALQVVA